MDDNERKIKMQELLELRNQLINSDLNNEGNNFIDQMNTNDTTSSSNESSKVKSFNNGRWKENKTNNQFDYLYSDKKAGMVNILMLSIITFVFECVFLFLSFMIYK